jgi:hypothetical protein
MRLDMSSEYKAKGRRGEGRLGAQPLLPNDGVSLDLLLVA